MGAVYALLGALLFGANGSLTKVIIDAGIDPLQLTLFRTLGAALLAGLVLAATDRGMFRLPWRRMLALAFLGVGGIAILQASYALAIARLPVGITLLLEFLAVLIVPLFALIVYRERIRASVWGASVCVLLGLALVAQVWDSMLDPIGLAFALLAAASLAFYFLYGERQIIATSPLATMFWGSLFAGLFWACFSGWWELEPSVFGTAASLGGALAAIELPIWTLLIITIAGGTFLPFLLSFLAIRRLRPTTAGIIASSEVVFAFAVAWLWLGEALDWVQLIGVAVVLVGIVLAQTVRPGSVADPNLAVATGTVEIVTGAIRVIPDDDTEPAS
ncbi:MAG TPA: DMT family transporter [Microbacteriaceae bacterium]|nr:DMT family transporter [Microbacteriaceae bacterium]